MATTLHGHYIPYSERTQQDEFHIRRAKKCGGTENCSDCKTEAQEWAEKHLADRLEPNDLVTDQGVVIKFPKIHPVEEAKMRHPSSNKSNHNYFDANGDPVIAWQVRELRVAHNKFGRFPSILTEDLDVFPFEVDLSGTVLRHVEPNTDMFRILDDYEWLVRYGKGLPIIVGNAHFKEYFSKEQGTMPPAEPVKEMVNHPAHYGGADNPYEVIKVIEAWELDFHLGTAVKYIPRAGKKDPELEIQDLEKSVFYLNRKIELLREKVKKSE